MLFKEFLFADDKQVWLFAVLILALLSCSSSSFARELEPVKQIRDEIHRYMEQNFSTDPDTEYEISYLDQRLKLDKCTIPLEVFVPVGAKQLGYSSLGVRCKGDKRWKIHVPVKIIRFAQVLTAKRTLTRGHNISSHDVQKMRMDISRLSHGYFTHNNEIKNMVLKRNLRQGQVITTGMLEIPRMIKRGEIITILANTNTLAIRVKGEALMDGRKNDVIRVKNHSSQREIQAKVISPGIVQVSM